MAETLESKTTTRDRSPAFPSIPLGVAVERLAAFEAHFKRSPARSNRVGAAWGMKDKSSQADSTLAALRAYGFVDYQGEGSEREAVISEDGRTLLRAQQDSIKKEVLRRAALKPRNIEKFWRLWGSDRPADAVCLDELILKDKFSDTGAVNFLKVYDATIGYAGLRDSAKNDTQNPADEPDEDEGGNEVNEDGGIDYPPPPPNPSVSRDRGKARVMEGERELTTGLLSKGASFRLIVNGVVGVKEIERLIAKLELDKEILAEQDDQDSD